MDADLESVETVLAQKLACGEPVIRKRALRALQNWVNDESKSSNFGLKSMERLCKGLYYVFWMQDKMLLQEEMADAISALLLSFATEEQSAMYVKSMFWRLSSEWPFIDRWRMDKFLMLIRRILRTVFLYERDKEWNPDSVRLFVQAFEETVISADKSFSEGLKFHFASVFLDELDNAGGLNSEQVTEILASFMKLLADRTITEYLFSSILDEVFVAILHAYEEDKVGEVYGSRKAESLKAVTEDAGIKFNYEQLSRSIFDIGRLPEVKSERRKRLYDVAKKFKAAHEGKDVFKMVSKDEVTKRISLPRGKVVTAAAKLLAATRKQSEKAKMEKQLHRKKAPVSQGVSDDLDTRSHTFNLVNKEKKIKPSILKHKFKSKSAKRQTIRQKHGNTRRK